VGKWTKGSLQAPLFSLFSSCKMYGLDYSVSCLFVSLTVPISPGVNNILILVELVRPLLCSITLCTIRLRAVFMGAIIMKAAEC
jgi:hypothetical protein